MTYGEPYSLQEALGFCLNGGDDGREELLACPVIAGGAGASAQAVGCCFGP